MDDGTNRLFLQEHSPGVGPSHCTKLLLITIALATSGAGSQAALEVAEDGAWCWFADPRAILVGDHLLSGWVSSGGDIVVSDRQPGGEATASVLHAALQKDDHANPALLALPDGRVMAFYSRHTGSEMFMRETVWPGQFDDWTPERSLQPISDRPNPITAADSRPYGIGGFLLTASELILMVR